MSDVMRSGSRRPLVRELQQLLNRELRPSLGLNVDGVFGPRTRSAVLAYQRDRWLVADGVVGPCTWAALRRTEAYCHLHPITLVPQWTNTTCWSAATAMLLGRQACMSSGPATATPEAGLFNDSELQEPVNMRRFARFHGLTMLPPQSWTASGLARLLEHRPIMINTLWEVDAYGRGEGSSGHMRVIAGIRGEGTAEGTTIRIYDPWPPHVGRIFSQIYGPFMRRVPLATYQILYR